VGELVHPTIIVGQYTLFGALASGGMGAVHIARRIDGPTARAVAVKRLHPHLRKEEEFAMMLLDEARLAMSVRHRNVVEVLDVVATDEELLLVMEYVPGLSLSELAKETNRARVPLEVAVTIAIDVLRGLHAAHEATSETGQPLGLVHRDVSPHNCIVGSAGVTKLTDFGVAKAVGRLRSTTDGGIKGKIAYMSPEQIAGGRLDARSDIYGAAVILWEMLAGRPMFDAESDVALFGIAMRGATERLASVVPDIPHVLDQAVWRALARDPRRRYSTAAAFADALAESGYAGSARDVAAWVLEQGRDALRAREEVVTQIVRVFEEPTLTHVTPPTSGSIRLVETPAPLGATTFALSDTVRRIPQQRSRAGALAAALAGFGAVLGVAGFYLRAQGCSSPPPPEAPSFIASGYVAPPPPPPPAADPTEVAPAPPPAASTVLAKPPPVLPAPTKRQPAAAPVRLPTQHAKTEPAAKPEPTQAPKGDCKNVDERGVVKFDLDCLRKQGGQR
jgi:serine/threonine-protein kinase